MNNDVDIGEVSFLSKLFSFSGVMNRQEYLIYGIIIPIILIGLGVYLNIVLEAKFVLIIVLLGGLIQLSSTVKRARDRNENIAVLIIALFAFSPIVILYLLFAPSKELEEGKNKKSRVLLYIFFGLLLIVIIGLILPKIMTDSNEDVREKLVCVNMKGISNSLKMFKLDVDRYPTTEEGFEALLINSYIDRYPLDSWGHEMKYIKKGDDFEIISYGKDGYESSDDILFSLCDKGQK